MFSKIKFLLRTSLLALDYKVRKRPYPLLVSISPTLKCNLRCSYCYADTYTREKDEYDIQQLIKISDEFIALGTQIFMIQGGEPLLYPGLRQLISHIKSKNKYCSLNTNGLLLDKKIESIVGIDKVIISLDGSRQLNDSVRGDGVYDRIISNITFLQQRGIAFMFHCVLGRDSTVENSIIPLVELAKKYKTTVSMCNTTKTGTEKNTNQAEALIDLRYYRKLAREILVLKNKGYPITNSYYFWQHILDWPLPMHEIGTAENLPANFRHLECVSGHLTAWLDADGTLFPCPTAYFRRDYSESIYAQGGIKGAWERLAKLKCKDCISVGESTPLFNFNRSQILGIFSYLKRRR